MNLENSCSLPKLPRLALPLAILDYCELGDLNIPVSTFVQTWGRVNQINRSLERELRDKIKHFIEYVYPKFSEGSYSLETFIADYCGLDPRETESFSSRSFN